MAATYADPDRRRGLGAFACITSLRFLDEVEGVGQRASREMNRNRSILVTCLIIVASCASVFPQNSKRQIFFDDLSSRLRAVKSVSNYDHGWGNNNEFYKLSKDFVGRRSFEELRRMTNDKNPVVRAMGLLCLAQSIPAEDRVILWAHVSDKETIYFHQGCGFSMITVGDFTKELIRNPYFLEPEGKPQLTQRTTF
jgi:hypothetical protein